MVTRTAFHLDGHGIIPECGYACSKCIEDVHAVVGKMPGVGSSCLDDSGREARIVVEHDPNVVSGDQLVEVFAGLPSRYGETFVPAVAPDSQLHVIDLAGTPKHLTTIEVGRQPSGIDVNPDGRLLLIGHFLARDIPILKVEGKEIVDTSRTLKLPGQPGAMRGPR